MARKRSLNLQAPLLLRISMAYPTHRVPEL